MSGTFVSKVYEGPFRDTGKWLKDFTEWCSVKAYKPAKHKFGTPPVPNVPKSMVKTTWYFSST